MELTVSAEQTRNRIIETADRLFYENGFENTSFANVAEAVGISRGNFYYHFKTKDEILASVIVRRLEDRTSLLRQWALDGKDPAARIACFIKILITNQTKIMAYGCPVGTLSNELSKLQHPLQGEAVKLFTLFADWLKMQFSDAGCGPRSGEYAMYVLSRSQGAATLANAYRDPSFIQREVDDMCAWTNERIREAH